MERAEINFQKVVKSSKINLTGLNVGFMIFFPEITLFGLYGPWGLVSGPQPIYHIEEVSHFNLSTAASSYYKLVIGSIRQSISAKSITRDI